MKAFLVLMITCRYNNDEGISYMIISYRIRLALHEELHWNMPKIDTYDSERV